MAECRGEFPGRADKLLRVTGLGFAVRGFYLHITVGHMARARGGHSVGKALLPDCRCCVLQLEGLFVVRARVNVARGLSFLVTVSRLLPTCGNDALPQEKLRHGPHIPGEVRGVSLDRASLPSND